MKDIPLIDEEYYYEDIHPYLNIIREYGEKCKILNSDARFAKNDVRNTYYSQLKNVTNSFYVAILSPFFMCKMNIAAKNGRLGGLFTDKHAYHVNKLAMLCEAEYIETWINMAKGHFVITSWLCFEDAIDLVYSKIVDVETKKKNKLQYFSSVEALIKLEVSEETLNSVKDKLSTEYVSVNMKYNYLLNLLKNSVAKKQLANIRNFLTFFNLLRNTSHYNTRPLKDFTAITPIGTFKFEKGVPIDFFNFQVLVDCLNQFMEIMELIRTNLVYSDEIANPYEGM